MLLDKRKSIIFATNPPYQMTFSACSFLKKRPEGVVTISALTDELMIIPSKIVAIFLVVIVRLQMV